VRRNHRILIVLLVMAASVGAVGPTVRAEGSESAATAVCGERDRPETGLQGDVPLGDQLSGRAFRGYNCGLALVGYNSLGRRGGNANMAWAGRCAFVAGVNGVAVVDVSNSSAPQLVTTLHGGGRAGSVGGGADQTLETIAAVRRPDGRSVLVAARYGEGAEASPAVPTPMDVFDVTDCRHPRFLTTYQWPRNVHNLTITPDGSHVWGSMPVQYLDISDPAHPTGYHDLDAELTRFESPLRPNQNSHEVWPSPDGTRLYIGSQVIGDETFRIIDISQWPAQPLTADDILSERGAPGHSIRTMSIGGHPYLVNSDESIVDATARGCLSDDLTPFGGVSRPRFTDIGDERHPVEVGQFRLEIGEPRRCAAQLRSRVNPSVHYQDVDNSSTNNPARRDTTFMMASSWNSGLRVVDVRDPAHPREVAYFNPGQFAMPGQSVNLDVAWAHSHWDATRGQIWLATATGGFWVLQLENGARRALGMAPLRHNDLALHGSIPRPRPSQGLFASPLSRLPSIPASYYCTLAVMPGRT
jgi:hypothetical protein